MGAGSYDGNDQQNVLKIVESLGYCDATLCNFVVNSVLVDGLALPVSFSAGMMQH